jgi:hypothetical protein
MESEFAIGGKAFGHSIASGNNSLPIGSRFQTIILLFLLGVIAMLSLIPGEILRDRYRIDSILGRGGMGAVYDAWDLNLGIRCAVKENQLVTSEARRQFEREARLLATLRHSNLPNVVDHFIIAGQGQYLVMSFIEGEDLRQRLDRLGPLPESDVCRWAADILNALAYLHQRHIVHRDINPANIKITPENNAVLVDFGIAKELEGAAGTTMAGARGGTPGFAPPEQHGVGGTDARSDIYAFGATLYTLLAGEPPADSFTRLTKPEDYVPISELGLNLSPSLVEMIEKAMAIEPDDRFANAQEMLIKLRNQPDGQNGAPTMTTGVRAARASPPALTRVGKRDSLATVNLNSAQPPLAGQETASLQWKWWVWGGAALLALLILILLGGLLIRGGFVAAPATQSPTVTVSPTVTIAPTLALAVTQTALTEQATQPPAQSNRITQTVLTQTTAAHILGNTRTETGEEEATQSNTETQTPAPGQTATQPFNVTPSAVLPTLTSVPPTATAPATATATATLTPVIALNPGTVSLSFGASTNVILTINTAQPSDTVVSLSSSNPGVAAAVNSVTIPAGGTSAAFSVGGQAVGSAVITATLPGGLGGGTSTAVVNVGKASTTTTISAANPNPAIVGQTVTVIFAVTESTSEAPAGIVTVTSNSEVVCSASWPASSQCVFTLNSVGTKALLAAYAGDANFEGSTSSPVSLSVNGLTISLDPPINCRPTSYTMTVTIGPSQPTNTTVALSSSDEAVATVPAFVSVPAGAASTTFTVSKVWDTKLGKGTATITAALPAELGGGVATANVEFAKGGDC